MMADYGFVGPALRMMLGDFIAEADRLGVIAVCGGQHETELENRVCALLGRIIEHARAIAAERQELQEIEQLIRSRANGKPS